jgi:hypothetical protein
VNLPGVQSIAVDHHTSVVCFSISQFGFLTFYFLCLIKPVGCGSENGFFSFIKTFGFGDFRQILELGLV